MFIPILISFLLQPVTATSIIFSYFRFFVASDVSVSSLHHNTFLKSFLSDFLTFFINVNRLQEDSEELKILSFVVEFINYFNYLSD